MAKKLKPIIRNNTAEEEAAIRTRLKKLLFEAAVKTVYEFMIGEAWNNISVETRMGAQPRQFQDYRTVIVVCRADDLLTIC